MTFAPYEGTTIVGFRPRRAPNPSCCSDPTVLCPQCARRALRLNSRLSVSKTVSDDFPRRAAEYCREVAAQLAANRGKYDQTDYLPLPPPLEEVLANERAEEQRKAKAGAEGTEADRKELVANSEFAHYHEVDYLPLPPSV